jgi:sensor histidine kinase YesM
MPAMTTTTQTLNTAPRLMATLARGFQASWLTMLLLVAINTGVAGILSIEDARPFWHPFISAQALGLCIAYAVNATRPWDYDHPIRRLVGAVVIGTVVGLVLLVAIKGYVVGDPTYKIEQARQRVGQFLGTGFSACVLGFCVGLVFLFRFREAHAAAVLHKAEAARLLMSKHAVEAELKLMQAQVEPHFLFNTLASVQYLTETDPKQAGKLLSHLIEYLRAALPQLRASSTTLGKEVGLAAAYLNILKMRMGPRLVFAIDVPADLASHPFPPNLLISLVENAIKHGVEAAADGGAITVTARHLGTQLQVTVTDTGRGGAAAAEGKPGDGVGLSNVRERLGALYGTQGSFSLVQDAPGGTRATLSIPFEFAT